jgi:hypothetical protein
MQRILSMICALAASTLALAPVAQATDAPPAHHIRGTVTKATPRELTIQTATGSVILPIDAKTGVIGVVPATAAEITSGTFIGTANVPGASSMSARALEVVVFPQSMAGAGEGDYPWDLPAGKGHSSMTNGTVGPSHGSMMTNATVTGVNNGAVKTVTLEYKGGSKKVTIAPGTPIVRIVPGSKSLLATGAHVVAFPGPSGTAARIVVGEEGVTPPM